MKMASSRVDKNEINILDIANKENFEVALKYLSKKNDSCGIDGMFLSELNQYWRINGSKLLRSIIDGTYEPGIVRAFDLVNYRGKKRSLSMFNSIDRLVLRSVLQKLQPVFEVSFNRHCYAFRNDYGVDRAVSDVCDYIEAGGKWMVKIDIKNFFDNIPLNRMESMLAKRIHDQKLMSLMQKLLHVKVEDSGRISRKSKGIIQGSPISPMLSNLYLTVLDNELENREWKFIRYSDDITAFFSEYQKAESAFTFIHSMLNQYGLEINTDKSGIFKSLGQLYLGYEFIRDSKTRHITAVNKQRSMGKPLYGWSRDSIKRIDHQYHIINDGVLTKRDYTILFESEDGKKYIPVEATDSLTIYSSVSFTSNFFTFANRHKINIIIVDKYGAIVGNFLGAQSLSKGKVLLKQTSLYLDHTKRLGLAKVMEIGYLHNVFSNMAYYARRNKSKCLDEATKSRKSFMNEMKEAKGVEQLLLIEARMRQKYYSMFNEIIRDRSYAFKQRTKQPPKDALNAMISFGNTLLYNRIATEIYKTSLDIRIGIIHSTNNRSQTLNLDIADLFKPIIVDRTIFTLVNRKMLDIKRDFRIVENGGIYLSDIGKRIFISEFNRKLFQKTTNGGSTKTYAARLHEEVMKIYRVIMFDEHYKPYKYQ